MNDFRQYAHVNSTGPPLPQVSQQVNAAPLPLAAQVPSPQPVVFNKQVSPQPVLHPLQQATLVLQQRKMSEVCNLFLKGFGYRKNGLYDQLPHRKVAVLIYAKPFV